MVKKICWFLFTLGILCIVTGILVIIYLRFGIKKTFFINNKEIIPYETTSIKISAAGDCTLGTDSSFGYNGQFDWWFKNKAYSNYDYYLENVKDIFVNDDYTYVNLEGTITDYNVKEKKSFNFKKW